ncbi:hypothetical protein COY00_00400 [Candidatus Pacearchaeota archaeon CG_4_10_14_0_2_um_filter_35_33]|nr:MAG: hypothetical protein COY79_04185 [Candidatus Pacearchaeota archaeon CG_4_10_14_0_8_um_filter_35_169]PIZ80791.1 MAG: hypothetical protein COY00_00400 [Candidatus Pacearchaeota archaeon CG_4_10_14_0_2_um_filter_35_33]PJA69624.1 MAG: hypothetical protein CO155_04305 [Candidatus Pacearchaeota archaeon CG_4_9_14_3_um_filter_35_19]
MNKIVKIFEKVQTIPYKVCKYDENEIDENIKCGDCRHKTYLLKKLYENEGIKVKKTLVVFDWADLPIPKKILDILEKTGTLFPHNILEIKIGNKWIKVDCSWDLKLKNAKFPITENWDGKSDTKQITEKKLKFFSPEEYVSKHKIKLVKEEAHKFASALNEFLDSFRK